MLEFIFGGWYELNAWLRLILTVPPWAVLLVDGNQPWWAFAVVGVASTGAVLALLHQRWPVLVEGTDLRLVRRVMPRTGRFRADLSGNIEALGGLGVVLLGVGPIPLSLAALPQLVVATCGVLYMTSAVSQWLMDAAWYSPRALRLAKVRWALGLSVAATAFGVFFATPGTSGRLIIGCLGALPFLLLLVVIPGEDLFVAQAMRIAADAGALARSDVSVNMHSNIKQPAVLLGRWLEIAGIHNPEVLEALGHLLLAIESERNALAEGTSSAAVGNFGDSVRALRVIQDATGRTITVKADDVVTELSDPTLIAVVNDLVVNAAQTGAGAITVQAHAVPLEERGGGTYHHQSSAGHAASEGSESVGWLVTVRVVDEGPGPNPATWLSVPHASTTHLARRLQRLGGDLIISVDQDGKYEGVVASWKVART